MTQFQHTLKALLEGRKTETSRIALPEPDGTGEFDCEMLGYPSGILSVQRYTVGAAHWRTIWQIDKDYAIQPGRTAKSVGRFQVEDVWRQDVRTLTAAQLEAEGFDDEPQWFNFVQLWTQMHDPSFGFRFDPSIIDYRVHEGRRQDIVGLEQLRSMIDARPAERYQAWRMTIRVLWDTVAWDAPAVQALHIAPKAVY